MCFNNNLIFAINSTNLGHIMNSNSPISVTSTQFHGLSIAINFGPNK